MKKTFNLTTNEKVTIFEQYVEAIEVLDNALALAILNKENYNATLTFNNYTIEVVEVVNGKLTKFWTKENQPCPN